MLEMGIRVGCVGAGWATGERHLPALARDPRVELVGIVDPHADRAAALAQRFSISNTAQDLDATWLDGLDAATVGVPPLAHADVVETLLARGIHVLCEKPLAWPPDRARGLVDQAEAAGLVLAVVQNFQFSEAGRRLFEELDAGRLGTPTATYGFQLSNPRRRLPHWAPDLPGGLFLDETAHLLYLTRRVLGRLELRSAVGRVAGNEVRNVSVVLEHDAVWSTLELNFEASLSEWQFVVVGSEATAAFDVFRDILVVLPNDGGHRGREVLRTSGLLAAQHLKGVATSGTRLVRRRLLYGNDEVVRRFLDAVAGDRSRLEGIEGRAGVEVVTFMDDVLKRLL
jgi:predicted dehydrogenase